MFHGLFKKFQVLPDRDDGEAHAALVQAKAFREITEKKKDMRPDEFADAVRQALEVRPI